MSLLINIIIVVLLGLIVLQDLKHRAISWFLLPALLSCFVWRGLLNDDVLLEHSLFNLGFVLIQLLVLTLYISIKKRKFFNIVNSYLGIGDILFFVVICAAFSPFNFICFYISSMILTLASMILYTSFSKAAKPEIPLAGGMAAVLIILMFVTFTADLNFYNDQLLLNSLR